MNVSIIIATCGDQRWSDIAFSRAFPSAREQFGLAGRPQEVIIEHHPSLSVSAARNAAAFSASGDFLVFLDADDEIEPGYVAAMQSAFIGGAITTDWSPLLVPAVRYVHHPEENLSWTTPAAAIPNRGRWPEVNECVIGTAIRRECFAQVGGFREWPSIEDYDLFLRCWDAGADLVYVEDAVYRAHVNTTGGRNLDQSCYAQIWADHEARVRQP